MADRIAVMNDGRIEQLGTPDGDLQAARLPLRRRLHRRLELLRATVDGDVATLADGRASRARPDGAGPADADGAARVDPARRTGGLDQRAPSCTPRSSAATSASRSRPSRARRPVDGRAARRGRRAAVGDEVAALVDGRHGHRAGGRMTTATAVGPPRRATGCPRGSARPSRRTAASCRRSSCSASSSSSRSGSSSVTRSGRRSTTPSSTTGRSTTTTTSSASPPTSRRCGRRSGSSVARDGDRDRARVPVRLLALALRPEAAAHAAARARDRPVLDELPAARLLVADDPRRPGRAEPASCSGPGSRTTRSGSSSTTGRP